MLKVSEFNLEGNPVDVNSKLHDMSRIADLLELPCIIIPTSSLWQFLRRPKAQSILTGLLSRYPKKNIYIECGFESQFGEVENEIFNSISTDPRLRIISGGADQSNIVNSSKIVRVELFERVSINSFLPGTQLKTEKEALVRIDNRIYTGICLNKRTVIHRLAFVEHLLSVNNGRNLISCPDTFWDFTEQFGESRGEFYLRDLDEKLDLSRSRWKYNGIGSRKFYNKLPLSIDVRKHTSANPPITKEYQNVIFDYVTETQFNSKITFVTEKSYRPMAKLVFPIFLGTPGTVSLLRKQGYRFDALDHSYDKISDHRERFIEVTKLVDWTQSLSREEAQGFYRDNVLELVHNYNIMAGKK